MSWIRKITGQGAPESRTTDTEETQKLRAELASAQEALEKEHARFRHLEEWALEAVQQSLNTRLVGLYEAVASPLSQIRTQASLLESGTTLEVADVMSVVQQIVHAIEDSGLEPIGSPGQVTQYDPETMRPLGEEALHPGDEVVVRFVGYRHAVRTIRRALVDSKK